MTYSSIDLVKFEATVDKMVRDASIEEEEEVAACHECFFYTKANRMKKCSLE